ncbi:uncharacterized protein LOC125237428 isoform X2 [Leguminivora glycinivorella]|uniref:uncharacterized protein LOC125237428 isoform X2 n=1 Tax=Leguminivora glycinivorella TaxID=1035111 RepID=UPI00200BF7A8|nr:uncharacterized protein LOC125237428 isoform X2 [Leguminivora glycinivorella]
MTPSIRVSPTAIVLVRSGNGTYVKARSLLDTGAACSIVKKSFADEVGLHQQFNGTNIFGIGDQKVNVPGTIAKVVFRPVGKIVPIISVIATVMYTVTGNIPYVNAYLKGHLDATQLKLADPKFDVSQDVDIIFGLDILNYIYTGSKILTNIPGVEAYGTCFGHVLMGALWKHPADISTKQLRGTSVEDYGVHATRLEEVLEKFWKVEQPPEDPVEHPEHVECERLYTSNTTRMPDGKYMVRLPLLTDRPALGESRAIAARRFYSLEAKLAKNPVFAEKYRNFMREYESLGHMSKSNYQFDSEHFIIPHHGIFKRDSDKLRVVFNGASQSSNGISVNQCLHSGKPLQNDITKILLNFRRHQFVFTADIRMMFRQTWIHPDDRRYQLILWREDPSQDLQISRCVALPGSVSYSLHGFGDASEMGYGACVYLRTADAAGNVMVRLIIAKTRVASKKTKQTIPKNELNAAHMVYKLLNHAAAAYEDELDIDSINAWSDSKITLCWLNTKPHLLQTFECNRVQDIQQSKRLMTWRYVRGELNPADVASRGTTAKRLLKCKLWWSPDWLLEEESQWPTMPVTMSPELPGFKQLVHVVAEEQSWEDCLLSRVSSYSKLINVTSYILRFCKNIRLPKQQRNLNQTLSIDENRAATSHWIKKVQLDAYKDEAILLKKGKLVCKSLQKLSVFVDEDQFIRVGGRLRNSSLRYEAKHPLLIPKDHRWTQLLMQHYHRIHCHASTSALINILRQRYWIPSARRQVARVIHSCTPCFRFSATEQAPFMADLPADRVTAARPFSGVATDFAGPYLVKASQLRNAKSVKAYLCVFVCLGTKAVHLELVSSLSTEAFIAAFTRFVSRRGLPSLVRSDQGTNFKGASSYLREVNQFLLDHETVLADEFRRQDVRWEFNPPGAAHMSGLVEAAVKSSKNLLKREIGDRILTFELLYTAFCRIEAVLNSRALVPMSEDPCDLEILSPGHFLIGQPLVSLPEPSWKDTNMSRLSHFQFVQAITQKFWAKYYFEYLNNLQSRNKWNRHVPNVAINDLVLIKDDNTPPLQWRRGRVIQIFKGSDDVVRSVKLKTQEANSFVLLLNYVNCPWNCN